MLTALGGGGGAHPIGKDPAERVARRPDLGAREHPAPGQRAMQRGQPVVRDGGKEVVLDVIVDVMREEQQAQDRPQVVECTDGSGVPDAPSNHS